MGEVNNERAFAPEDAFEPMGAKDLVQAGVIPQELGELLARPSKVRRGEGDKLHVLCVCPLCRC